MLKSKKIISVLLLIFIFSIKSIPAIAFQPSESQIIRPVIDSLQNVKIGEEVIFDAKDSFIEENFGNEIEFVWDLGDGTEKKGEKISHIYEKTGKFEVVLTIKTNNYTESIKKELFIYNKTVLLISDSKKFKEKYSFFDEYAKKENIYLITIDSFNANTDFISQEILIKKLSQETRIIEKSKDIIIWTEENSGINALSRLVQVNTSLKPILNEKNILIIGDINSMDTQRLSAHFKTLNPKKMIVSKEMGIYGIIDYKEDKLKETLINLGVEFIEIDEKSGNVKIWNIVSYTVNKLINKGVPESTIALILLLPVIISILIFYRQIIGLVFPNIVFPTLIILTFLVIGLYAGLFILILSSISIYTTKNLTKKSAMLYTTKTGIVLIINSFLVFILLIFNDFLEIFDTHFFSIAIIPTLFLATITEQVIKNEKGIKKNINLTIQLLLICVSIYFLVGGQISMFSYIIQFTKIKEFFLLHPETIPFLLIFTILIGKWTGLRLLERIRFRYLIRNLD